MRHPLVATAAAVAFVASYTAGVRQPPLHAQDRSPAFEVASIKRNRSADGLMTMGMQPGGRLTMIGVPVRALIVRAFGVQPNQIVGAPDWTTSERYDVVAKAETDASPAEMNLMVRALLVERFKLVAHEETRELAIYELVAARDDGRLGPELKPAATACAPLGRGRLGGPPPPAPPPPGADATAAPGPMGCRVMFAPGRVQAGGQPLSVLATNLSNIVGRPIVDKTGLTGGYDLTLTWTPDQLPQTLAAPPPGAPPLPPIDPDGPSLFTALQEQLGLKLESARGPVDVLVIDSIERPTED